MEFINSLLAFIVSIGILITFHEYGHFCVAKFFDVKILRFSIGFGKSIFIKHFGKDETEFSIAALPLGGYVKMLDSREGNVAKNEMNREFNGKPLWQRFCIVLAGPVFNFILAIILYTVIYTVGVQGLKPIIGEVESSSMGAKSGFVAKQEIVSVNGIITPTWSNVVDSLVSQTVSGDTAKITVKDIDGIQKSVYLDLSRISIDEIADGKLLKKIGIVIEKLEIAPIIGDIVKNSPGEASGLQKNDKIIAVNDEIIESWDEWVEIIRRSPNQQLNIDILRNETIKNIALVPENILENGKNIGRIGVRPEITDDLYESYFALEQYSLHLAILKAFDKTWEMSVLTLKVLGKIIIGDASVKNLSGPISIAKYAGQSASIGFTALLTFLAIVSISLGVLNLLPIPLLDGGHLVYYIIEFITGRPVSDSMQIIGQQIGIVLLLSLMSIALYNDFIRLLG
ncbi:MAG: RIP metalloprotease RseP [Legionellales bacterium]|nr:RIP metalloprotease RseP [Legionellales bacterium]MBK68236.1 RIP metalloprotease RseP [Legionellales bacterium]|tara:strand:- start:3207 stop:4571 length:1365 start_codon:yes stop_codon:yes gene_type:complete